MLSSIPLSNFILIPVELLSLYETAEVIVLPGLKYYELYNFDAAASLHKLADALKNVP